MKTVRVSVLFLAIIGVTLGCTPAVVPSPAAQGKPAGEGPAARGDWEQKWASTLTEARREGKVIMYTGWGPSVTGPLREAFGKKHGIELESANVGSGSALLPKVQAENNAKLRVADIFSVGTDTLMNGMKPAGLLGPADPLLILPEVTGPDVWTGGRFPFLDKDRTTVKMLAVIQRYISYNTTLVKEGEITSYKDLLKPQYKGKISMSDPSVSGAASSMFSHIAYDLWNLEEASDWLRLLIKQQEVVVTRDDYLVVDWTARGKYFIGIAGKRGALIEYINAGAPISLAVQTEGHPMGTAAGAFALPPVQPHPNAAAVFVNWLLTREGQTLLSKGYGFPSIRRDVLPEGFHPLFLPLSGEKMFSESEESIMRKEPLQKISREIIEKAGR
ncbi:MAG: extracellular solute-binding protein [Chloroflexi bacterium]|nr:extracellular solute-binding protein [Chloroflexota bacterium]